jgi:hypothetical protein
MAHDVFISHSSRDRPAAEAALAALERAGRSCWIAPRDIVPGQDYGEAIIDGIRASSIFLLVLSASSVDSPQVRRETERAANADIPIVPFRIEDVQPSKSLEYFISSAHWLDAFPPPLERHLDYLVTVVARLLDRPAAGEPPGAGAAAAPTAAPAAPPPMATRARWPLFAGLGAAALALLGAAAFVLLRPAPARACTAVPDTAQTGFAQRATPMRGDKPLWLRAGPSPRARRVTRIGPDEIFRVLPDARAQWWPARLCDGTTGFVARRFVTLVGPATPAAGKAPR